MHDGVVFAFFIVGEIVERGCRGYRRLWWRVRGGCGGHHQLCSVIRGLGSVDAQCQEGPVAERNASKGFCLGF